MKNILKKKKLKKLKIKKKIKNILPFFTSQVLIPKLKDPDPNPGVTISVLAAIGEQAQVSGAEMKKWMDDLLPMILEMLQDSSSLHKREVRQATSNIVGNETRNQ